MLVQSLLFILAVAVVGFGLFMTYDGIVGIPRVQPKKPYVRAFFLILSALLLVVLFFTLFPAARF